MKWLEKLHTEPEVRVHALGWSRTLSHVKDKNKSIWRLKGGWMCCLPCHWAPLVEEPDGLNHTGKLDRAGEEVSTAATGEQEQIRGCPLTYGWALIAKFSHCPRNGRFGFVDSLIFTKWCQTEQIVCSMEKNTETWGNLPKHLFRPFQDKILPVSISNWKLIIQEEF